MRCYTFDIARYRLDVNKRWILQRTDDLACHGQTNRLESPYALKNSGTGNIQVSLQFFLKKERFL